MSDPTARRGFRYQDLYMLRRVFLSCARSFVLEGYRSANAIWCADFKGWFPTGDGVICTPITITDGCSRYILRCQGLSKGTGQMVVKPIFETVKREFGVPEAIQADDGPPFASGWGWVV